MYFHTKVEQKQGFGLPFEVFKSKHRPKFEIKIKVPWASVLFQPSDKKIVWPFLALSQFSLSSTAVWKTLQWPQGTHVKNLIP
jgi:hypothetical protein